MDADRFAPMRRRRTRVALVAIGVMGLLGALFFAALIELTLQVTGVEGTVSPDYFSAIASIIPLLALGLLVQIATTLSTSTRDFRGALEEAVTAFEERYPDRRQDIAQARMAATRLPTVMLQWALAVAAGLVLQFVVGEGLALMSIATESTSRAMAVALGILVGVQFFQLLLLSAALAWQKHESRSTRLSAADFDRLIEKFGAEEA